METDISSSGLEFNKITNPNFTIGIRKDGIKDKLFGLRPNSNDNHNYQFEITFDSFQTPTIILDDTIKTDYTDKSGLIDISDNTLINYSESSTKHLINIEGVDDNLFFGKYVINHTGYCFCPKNNLIDIDFSLPFMKGLKFCAEDPGAEINDLDFSNYIYIWIGDDCIHTTDHELSVYLNDSNPYASLEELIFMYGEFSEPISWDWFIQNLGLEDITKLKYSRKELKFKANHFMTDLLTIKHPTLLDSNLEIYEHNVDHYVYEVDENTIMYFKIPSLINIIDRSIQHNKWLDIDINLAGSVAYTGTIKSSVDGLTVSNLTNNLFLVNFDHTMSSYLNCASTNVIIAGVSSIIPSTSMPYYYPFLVNVVESKVVKIIRSDTDKSVLETYLTTNSYTGNYYTLQKRTITLGNYGFISDIGTSSVKKKCILSHLDVKIGTVSSKVTLNSATSFGILVGRVYLSSIGNGFIYDCDLEAYCDMNFGGVNNIGGFIGYGDYLTVKNCSHTHYGKITGNLEVGLSFGRLYYGLIDHFTQYATDFAQTGTALILDSNSWNTGGLCGRAQEGTFINIKQTIYGNFYSDLANIAGICGNAQSLVAENIEQEFYGNIETNISNTAENYGLGGMFGYCSYASVSNITQNFVGNLRYIRVLQNIGGIVAFSFESSWSNIKQSFSGDIYGASGRTSGVFGGLLDGNASDVNLPSNFTNIHTEFSGNITNTGTAVSGFHSFFLGSGKYSNFNNIYVLCNDARMSVIGSYHGGFCGNIRGINAGTITSYNCKNITLIVYTSSPNSYTMKSVNNYVGGFVGISKYTRYENINMTSNAYLQGNTYVGSFCGGTDGGNPITLENINLMFDNVLVGSQKNNFLGRNLNGVQFLGTSSVNTIIRTGSYDIGYNNLLYSTNTSRVSNTQISSFNSTGLSTALTNWADWSGTNFQQYPILINDSNQIVVYKDFGPVSSEDSGLWSSNINDVRITVGENLYYDFVNGDLNTPFQYLGSNRMEDLTINSSAGSITEYYYLEDDFIYRLSLNSGYSPHDLVSNWYEIKKRNENDSRRIILYYIPRGANSIYTTNRYFLTQYASDDISTLSFTPSGSTFGYYFIDDTGSTITFGDKTIDYTATTITLNSSGHTNGDIFVGTFTSGSYTFYALLGSLEIDIGAAQSGGGGDPHIQPFLGDIYDLPHEESSYLWFDNNSKEDRVVIKVKCWHLPDSYIDPVYKRMLLNHLDRADMCYDLLKNGVFFKYVKIKYGVYTIVIDLDDLEFREHNNHYDLRNNNLPVIDKPFTGKKIGISRIRDSEMGIFTHHGYVKTNKSRDRLITINTNEGRIRIYVTKDRNQVLYRNSIRIKFDYEVNLSKYSGAIIRRNIVPATF